MNRNNMLLLAGAVAIVGLAVVFAWTFMSDQDEGSDQSKIVDVWYEVYYEHYDSEGNYVEDTVDDAIVMNYTLAIYRTEGNSFIAEYNGDAVVGTYSDGILMFDGWFGGERAWFVGSFLDDNTLYASIVWYEHRSELVYSASAVFSNERVSSVHDAGATAVLGDWTCQSARQVSAEHAYDLKGTALTVTSQTGNVFFGTMEQMEGTEVVQNAICGTFTGSRSDGYAVAYVIDETFNIWTVLISEGQIVMMITDESETEPDRGSVCVAERIFTRGGAVSAMPNAFDFTGTWYSDAMVWMDNDGEVNTNGSSYVLTVSEQDGQVFKGMIDTGYREYQIVGFTYGGASVYLQFHDNSRYNANYVGHLNKDGTISLSMYSEVSGWYSSAASTTLTQSREVPSISAGELVGYWYNVNNYQNTAYGDYDYIWYTDSHMEEPLIVLSTEDGLFRGYYGGEYIVGSYTGGKLYFCNTIGDQLVTMYGWAAAEGTLELVVLRSNVADSTAGWSISVSMLNKNHDYVPLPRIYDADYSGDWNCVSATQYSGEATELATGKLTLKQSYGDMYTGTMTQTVGTETVDKTIFGVLIPTYDSGVVRGVFIDSSGLVWQMNGGDDYLVLSGTFVTDAEPQVGEHVSVMRTYVREGTVLVADIVPDLSGTWVAYSSFAMCADGTTHSYNQGGYVLTIGEMYGHQFAGTGTDRDYNTMGSFVGYVDLTGSTLKIISDYGRGADNGFGYLMERNTIVLYECFTDEDGCMTVCKTVLTRL